MTCIAVNDAEPATLTLVKHVVNDHGGTARPDNWTLTATPGSSAEPAAPELSGVTGSAAVTGATVPPGVPYRLSEAGPAGYRLTSLSCARVGPDIVVPVISDVVTSVIG